jgi:hypothetical protein
MTMHSAEIRWFIEGDLQEQVLSWFSKGALAALKSEPTREDKYLVFPDSDTVGVKLREVRSESNPEIEPKVKFEIKVLAANARPINLGGGINGRTDQWVRWSFDNDGLAAMQEALYQSGHWVSVRKTRYLRKFSADSGKIVKVLADERPHSGCNVELTSIEVETQPHLWFSLAFEAFGPPSEVAKILDDTLQYFFKNQGDTPMQLSGRNSLSYPAWIATLE